MKKFLLSIVLAFLCISNGLRAQLVGGNMFLRGHWLEIGMDPNASFGACTSPAGYHPHDGFGGLNLAEVYDYGHDGWAVGTPAYMGDYTYPGSPFEGWEVQVGTSRGQAFENCAGTMTNIPAAFGLTGAMTTYSNTGGRAIGNWAGTCAGGSLSIKQETRVDTEASWVVVTTRFYNLTAAAIANVYYMRSCDPDNNESWAGSFTTINTVDFQNDIDHRVQVRATTSPGNIYPFSLCTKDCRAVALIYSAWPLTSGQDLATLWSQTYGPPGTGAWYGSGHGAATYTGDVAIALVYNLGTIAANDSAVISYAYTFNGAANGIYGVDSAFPEPLLRVNNVPIPPTGPAPDVTRDTFNACLYPGMTTLPVSIMYGDDKCWTWSSWSWSPALGLATATGVKDTINLLGLPPIITYTITGTDSNVDMHSCNHRIMYLTIITCNGATCNSPCLGDSLIFNAPGDSTGATYSWYGPAPSTAVVGSTQSFFISPSVWADTGTYHVIKTVAGVSDTSVTVAVIHPVPVITGPTDVCTGSTITLTSSVPGSAWTSLATGTATVGGGTGVVTGVSPGVVTIDAALFGCVGSYTVTVDPVAPITGTASVCVGSTTTLSDAVGGGTWGSSNSAIASVAGGVVTGVNAGTATISYTTSAGCLSTRVVTVNGLAPITGANSICLGGNTTLSNLVPGGTWSSSNTGVATVGLTNGVVSGVGVGTSIITYTTPAGCVSTFNISVVIVTSITGNMVVCQGFTSTLADGSGGGVWTSSNTAVATIGSSNGILTGLTPGTSVITYTGGLGCYTTSIVTVNPSPGPIGGLADVCHFLTITLTDPAPGGVWTSSNSTIASIGSGTGVVTGTDYDGLESTATITYTLPTGCKAYFLVHVHPKPPAPLVNSYAYCQLDNASPLTAIPGTDLIWFGPGITAGYAAAPTPHTDTPGTFDYFVLDTSSYGCISDSSHIVGTIHPQPAPPTSRDTMYCRYSTVAPLTYQVDSADGSYLKWYSNSGTYIGTWVNNPDNTTVTYPTGTKWFVSDNVTYTDVPHSCESVKDTVKVTIVYQPEFTINSNRFWVCDHDSLNFWYSGSYPLFDSSYTWVLPVGASFIGGSTPSDSFIHVKFDTVQGEHVISLAVRELNGMCVTYHDTLIDVIALPTTHCYLKPDICLGDTVSLSLSDRSPTAAVFEWDVDGVIMQHSPIVKIIAANSNSGGPYSISITDSGIHQVTIKCTTEEGCKSDPTYDTVNVHPLPNPGFGFNTTGGVLCLEDSVLFTAFHQDHNCKYHWEPEHFFNNDNKWVIWGKVEQSRSEVTLTVTDEFGCHAASTQELDPQSCCTVAFPTAFTPGAVGTRNCFFHPLYDGYHRFHEFRIMNRWGQIVFESTDSDPKWDGRYNGVPQDLGVYYYYLKYDCGGETKEVKGDCTLIR